MQLLDDAGAAGSAVISRRQFLSHTTVLSSACVLGLSGAFSGCSDTRDAPLDFPLIDFHVHLEQDLSLEKALEISKQRGVKFGIVEHAGCGFELGDDAALTTYLDHLKQYPVYVGIQAERLNWHDCFSVDTVARLDYVLSDALRLPVPGGDEISLWQDGVTVEDPEDFMERYVAHNIAVIQTPIDIIASFTFLPACLQDRYDALWTTERMQRVIAAAVQHNVAMEISSRRNIPSIPFVNLAKDAGGKFSFGTNKHDGSVGKLDYSIKVAKACGLTREEMFVTRPDGRKPIQVR
jgi:hypothetical protein